VSPLAQRCRREGNHDTSKRSYPEFSKPCFLQTLRAHRGAAVATMPAPQQSALPPLAFSARRCVEVQLSFRLSTGKWSSAGTLDVVVRLPAKGAA
jgi:hypothetical protein